MKENNRYKKKLEKVETKPISSLPEALVIRHEPDCNDAEVRQGLLTEMETSSSGTWCV